MFGQLNMHNVVHCVIDWHNCGIVLGALESSLGLV